MEEQLSRKFGKLMHVGNVTAAIRLLSNPAKGDIRKCEGHSNQEAPNWSTSPFSHY